MRFKFQYDVYALVVLAVAALPEIASAQPAHVSISISEFGEPSSWSIGVDTPLSNRFLNIVAPDGSVLEPEPFSTRPSFLPAGKISHVATFDTLESALSFVSGEWSTTEVTTLFADRSETFMRQFTVNPIASDDLNRSIPIVSSPAPGFTAQKDQAFLLAWDYETLADDDEAPSRSVVTRQRTEPIESGFSRAIVGTPTGSEGSSGGGGGSPDFNTSLRNEPGADTNRWLFTASGDAAFLQTFDIGVGSFVELDEFLVSPSEDPTNPLNGPLAALSYSRLAETLTVNLVDRPTCFIPDGGLAGDFDGNGTVEFSDFLTLSQNFARFVTTYEEGDADCDGFVAFGDFLALSKNFGRTTSETAAVAIPEPSTMAMALCGIGMILIRRRRS